jgi:hypothetical protein
VVGFCEGGNEPSGSIKKAGYFLTSWVTISFPNNILRHRPSSIAKCHVLEDARNKKLYGYRLRRNGLRNSVASVVTVAKFSFQNVTINCRSCIHEMVSKNIETSNFASWSGAKECVCVFVFVFVCVCVCVCVCVWARIQTNSQLVTALFRTSYLVTAMFQVLNLASFTSTAHSACVEERKTLLKIQTWNSRHEGNITLHFRKLYHDHVSLTVQCYGVVTVMIMYNR